MKMKRVLAYWLVLLLTLCMTACNTGGSESIEETGDESEIGAAVDSAVDIPNGGNSAETSASTKPTGGQSSKQTSLSWAEVKKTIPASARGKTIEIMDWNNVSAVAEAQSVIDRFTKETGIKVKFTTEAYDTFSTKVAARVSAQNPPDIVRVREQTPRWIKYLQPLTDSGYNFNDTAWDKETMRSYTFNGKIYATNMVNSPYYEPSMVVYNANLVKKYKLEDPYKLWKDGNWTWDKMHEIAQTFVKSAGAGYYGVSTLFGEYSFSQGIPWVTCNGTAYQSNLTNTNMVKCWQYMNRWYQKGVYDKQPLDTENMNNGRLLFIIDDGIGLRTGHFYYKELKKNGYAKAVPIPQAGKQYYQPIAENVAYGIPQGAKNASLAPYLLRYLLDSKNYNMTNFYYDKKTGAGSVAEVVDWTRTQKRIYVLSTMLDGSNGQAGTDAGWFVQDMLTCTQPKVELEKQFAPGVNNACNEGTKVLKSLK